MSKLKETFLWAKTIIWDGSGVIDAAFISWYLNLLTPEMLIYNAAGAALSATGKLATTASSIITQKNLLRIDESRLSDIQKDTVKAFKSRQNARIIQGGKLNVRKTFSDVENFATCIIFPPLSLLSFLADIRNITFDIYDNLGIYLIKNFTDYKKR